MNLKELWNRALQLSPTAKLGAGLGAVLVVAVVGAGLAFAFGAFGGSSGGDDDRQAAGGGTPTKSPSAVATNTAPARPSVTPAAVSAGLVTPLADNGPEPTLTEEDLANRGPTTTVAAGPFGGTRLVIPRAGIDAPFTIRTVGSDGVMGNPQGPTDVAWYDFSGKSNALGGAPGLGGNAIISGHVDYVNYGPAVFWNIRNLVPGDEVQIVLDDGSVARYIVEWNRTVDGNSADWASIVAATAQESLTLITCTGQFDTSTRSYDMRQIVWAVRVS